MIEPAPRRDDPEQHSDAVAPSTCSHCAAALSGPFCSNCGQEVRTERLTAMGVIREGLSEFLDLDSGLLRTVRELLVAPDRVIGGWWHGHTRAWVHPARFFLLAFAIAQVVAWRTGALADFASGYMTGTSHSDGLSESSIVQLLSEYFVLFAAGGLVLPVVVGAVVGRRTLAEQVVFAAFAFGELALLGSLLLLVDLWVPVFPGPWAVVLLTPAYLGWAVRRVFGAGLIRTTLATAGLLLGVLMGSTFIAGVIDGFTR